MASACRSCDAPVMWARNAKTNGIEPLDAEPRPDGNIQIIGTAEGRHGEQVPKVRHLLKGEAELPMLMDPPPRYVSHFVTCPDAQEHRKDP